MVDLAKQFSVHDSEQDAKTEGCENAPVEDSLQDSERFDAEGDSAMILLIRWSSCGPPFTHHEHRRTSE